MVQDPAPQPPSAAGDGSAAILSARAKYAKEVNLYINDYIRFADLKAGAVLTIAIAVTGAMGKVLPEIFAAANHSHASGVVLGLLSIGAAIAAACTILFSAFALTPRTPRASPQSSLNSYPDVAKKDPEAYARAVAALTENDIVYHLCIHNVVVSGVAVRKFDAVTTAVKFLLALLFFSFAIAILSVLASLSK